MFITRLGELSHPTDGEETEGEVTAVITAPHGKKPHATGIRAAFGFDSLEPLLTVCRRLAALSFDGESEAYWGDDRRCYLLLSELETAGYLPLDEYSFIGEYGTVESPTALQNLLGEHARPICTVNAVACLSEL